GLRGFSEHRIPEVPRQFAKRGGVAWKNSLHQVRGEVRMEELEPGEPGNLFGDGQLADRRRSIQQNQFHDALSSSMRLPPHAGSEPRPAAGAQRTLAGIGSTPPLTLVLSEHLGKSCPSPAVPTRAYAHSASAVQSERPSAALPAASGPLRLDAHHTR